MQILHGIQRSEGRVALNLTSNAQQRPAQPTANHFIQNPITIILLNRKLAVILPHHANNHIQKKITRRSHL
jgi:hypothetical protein